MIQIFKSKDGFAVRTTCLDPDAFIADLSEALANIGKTELDEGISMLGVLTQAMPIAFKLAGYKADSVQEQRTLFCGIVAPHESELITTAGR